MLTIELPSATEGEPPTMVDLEHSLVSVHKWEAKYKRPFFNKQAQTIEETLDYFRFMALSPLPEDFPTRLTPELVEEINEYMSSSQTATWFREDQQPKGRAETVTAELVYYWMIQFQIPAEYRFWHFNQLMTLIRICGVKQTPPKKMSKQSQMEEMRRLNAQRLKDMGTTG